MDHFEIVLKELVESTTDLPESPPEDDADDLDLCLWRYCHDHNRRIAVRAGSGELEVELDPDFRIMLLSLPKEVRGLAAGKKGSLSFSERGFDLYLNPDGETIWCTPHRWGVNKNEPTFACSRIQVIGELWRFLQWIAREAVTGCYLSREQARSFLGDRLTNELL